MAVYSYFRVCKVNVLVSVIFRVYCADHTYCTLRLSVDTPAESIKLIAADKLKMRANDDLWLVEVKSNGERVVFKDEDISIPTALSINGRIFVSPKDHLDALVSEFLKIISIFKLTNEGLHLEKLKVIFFLSTLDENKIYVNLLTPNTKITHQNPNHIFNKLLSMTRARTIVGLLMLVFHCSILCAILSNPHSLNLNYHFYHKNLRIIVGIGSINFCAKFSLKMYREQLEQLYISTRQFE